MTERPPPRPPRSRVRGLNTPAGPGMASHFAPHLLVFSLSVSCFHDQKKYFFTFSVFFFKVITEQVVVDANLPSVSKESVGRVGAGAVVGAAGAAPPPAKGPRGRSGLGRGRGQGVWRR